MRTRPGRVQAPDWLTVLRSSPISSTRRLTRPWPSAKATDAPTGAATDVALVWQGLGAGSSAGEPLRLSSTLGRGACVVAECQLPEEPGHHEESGSDDDSEQGGGAAKLAGQGLRRDGYREGHWHGEGEERPQPGREDGHGPAPCVAEQRLKDHQHVLQLDEPECAGRQQQQEAVDDHQSGQEHHQEQGDIERTERDPEPSHPVRDHADPDHHVGGGLWGNRLHAGQQLGIGRLGQQEVEGAQSDALHQRLHRGPHHDADQPGDEEVDADQHQQVVRPPAAQVGGSGEDHRQRQHLGDQADQRVQQRDEEVGTVLHQVEHAQRQKRSQHPQSVSHAPTAEYRRVARRHSSANPPSARTIQPSWAAYPSQMADPVRRPRNTSTGKARLHGNGVQTATVCIHPGSTASGAKIPPKKVVSAKNSELIAVTLVSQKADRARHHSTAKRSTIASTSAGRNGSTVPSSTPDRSASKATPISTAAGSTPSKPSALYARFSQTSPWIGWIGRIRSGENAPVRIRHSNSHMCQMKVMWSTTIMTRKYATNWFAV